MNTAEFLTISASIVPEREAVVCGDVRLKYRAKREELTYMVNNSEASAFFVGERYLELVSAMRPEIKGVRHFVCYAARPPGMQSYEDILAKYPPEEIFVEIDGADP